MQPNTQVSHPLTQEELIKLCCLELHFERSVFTQTALKLTKIKNVHPRTCFMHAGELRELPFSSVDCQWLGLLVGQQHEWAVGTLPYCRDGE